MFFCEMISVYDSHTSYICLYKVYKDIDPTPTIYVLQSLQGH